MLTRAGRYYRELRTHLGALRREPRAGHAGALVAGQAAATLVGLLTSLLSARVLGPAAFGTAALLLSFPSLVWSVAQVKTVSVTTRYLSSFRAQGQDDRFRSMCKLGYCVDLGVALVAFGAVSLTGWWVAPRLLGLQGYGGLMVLFAASYPVFSLAGTSSAILDALGRFRFIGAMHVVFKVLVLAVTGALLWRGEGVAAVVLGAALGQAAFGVILAAAAVHFAGREGLGGWWRARLDAVAPLRSEITAFFGWSYLLVTSRGVLQQGPLMLLGRVAGTEAAGFYRLALSLTTVATYLEVALSRVTYPQLSAWWSTREWSRLRASLRRWTLQGGLPAALLLLLAIPLLPFGVPLLLGPRYAGMVPGAQLMLVGTAASAVLFWLQPAYFSAGRAGAWVRGHLVSVLLVLGMGYVAIAEWGYLGISAVSALGQVGLTLFMAWRLQRNTRALRGDPGSA